MENWTYENLAWATRTDRYLFCCHKLHQRYSENGVSVGVFTKGKPTRYSLLIDMAWNKYMDGGF